jgi:hypothetical protein
MKPAIYQPKINFARCFLPELRMLEAFPHISPTFPSESLKYHNFGPVSNFQTKLAGPYQHETCYLSAKNKFCPMLPSRVTDVRSFSTHFPPHFPPFV